MSTPNDGDCSASLSDNGVVRVNQPQIADRPRRDCRTPAGVSKRIRAATSGPRRPHTNVFERSPLICIYTKRLYFSTFEWDEPKRLWNIQERHLDLVDAKRVFDGR